MQQALRPYATAAVALVGAGLISATPMAPRLPDIGTFRDVTLTTADADLTPWIDVFNTASADATTLLNTFSAAPFVAEQQLVANEAGWLQGFFNDPTSSTVASISQEMQADLAAVLTGVGLQNASIDTTDTVLQHTLAGGSGVLNGHIGFFAEIPSYIPADEAATATPIIDFLASPDSGVIMGLLGPEISPWVALINSIDAGDGLNETLANMVGGFFNGATLNLDSIVPAIQSLDLFPAGMSLTGLSVAFGGLLSTGSVGDAGDGVGGSILNSVGLDASGVPVIGTIDLTGEGVGPLGALEGLDQTIATLLGWDGSGSPLADVTLPTIPADLLDSGTAAATAAADLSSLVQDLVSGLGL